MKKHLDQVKSRVLLICFANNVIFAFTKHHAWRVSQTKLNSYNLDHDVREIIPLLQGTEKISRDYFARYYGNRRKSRTPTCLGSMLKKVPQKTGSIRRRNGVISEQNLLLKISKEIPKLESVGHVHRKDVNFSGKLDPELFSTTENVELLIQFMFNLTYKSNLQGWIFFRSRCKKVHSNFQKK